MISDAINQSGWIYVGVDLRDPRYFKLGLTTRANIYKRFSDTTNPFYMLLRGYRIPAEFIYGTDISSHDYRKNEAYYLERYIHKELEKNFKRQKHHVNNSPTEWFEGDWGLALGCVNYFFARTVHRLDENGNAVMDNLTYDPVLNSGYFYNIIEPYKGNNIHIDKLFKKFNEEHLEYSTFASVLDIPIIC